MRIDLRHGLSFYETVRRRENLVEFGFSLRLLLIPVEPGIIAKAHETVINTDRRTYHVELRATTASYMASVSWTYPADELIALQTAEAEAARAAPVAGAIDLAALNFRYRISGDKVAWRPVRAFDDTRQLFIEFGADIAAGDMPPLFVLGGSGEAELVNYRVQGRYMIVDRLFERGELRLGAGKQARTVRIERETLRRRSRS
jgi:type IV secretion system protein VirB9